MRRLFSWANVVIFSSTARDTFWVFGANVLCSFFAFLYTIFLARSLSPADFGIFSAVFAFMLLVADISDFGMGSALSRFLPELKRESNKRAISFLKTSFLFQIYIAIFASGTVVLLSSFLARILLKNTGYTKLYLIGAVGIFGVIVLAFTAYALSALKKFKETAIINSFSTLAKLIPVVILSILSKLNIYTALTVFAFSSFGAYFLSFLFLPIKYIKHKKTKGDLKKLLSFSVFLGISKVFSAIASRLDALMLVPLSSAYAAGIYSGANKIAFLYPLLAGSFSSVIAPRLSGFATFGESIRYLKKISLVIMIILFSMAVMYIIAPWFVILVLGRQYVESVEIFRLLLIPMAFFTLTIAPVNFLIYSLRKPQVSTFNTFFQLIIIFLGNLFLIPTYGVKGPIISLAVAYSFTFFSAVFFAIYFYDKSKK